MRDDSLAQWLAWLERAHPSEIELGLDRVGRVFKALALERERRVITVAGTNGKGSCVAFASALLLETGVTVGSYTSPHLHHYCERVRIDSEPVGEADMCRAFQAVDAARGDISLTYFEFGTLAALWLFDHFAADVWVLEVGLGGRLDAVNIIDADVAVITSIALDHEAWLGGDRESIAREKAGIMRAERPVICADPEPPVAIVETAAQIRAPLAQLGRDFSLVRAGVSWRYRDADQTLELARVHLPPASVAAAIRAVGALGYTLAPTSVAQVAQTLSLPGRLQRLSHEGGDYLLDVAHNPAATANLARAISDQAPASVVFVFAVMADKDLAGVLAPLEGIARGWYLAELPDVPRAASVDAVKRVLDAAGESVSYVGAMEDCLTRAAGGDDDTLVVVCGSFFTVAAALAILAPDGQTTGAM